MMVHAGSGPPARRRIVGLMLLRNEDRFVTWAVRNVVHFCDELILLDNGSSDDTPARLAALTRSHPHVRIEPCDDPNTSQRALEGYAGQNVWVFGVDGDEIYDPEGLARLRPRILAGEFDAYWRVDGYMLHAVHVELDRGCVEGHVNPAAPGGTKLYNFAAIESWRESSKERLHGRNMVFRPGFARSHRCELFRREHWETCDFRSLHLCFYPRSSVDTSDPSLRPNPADLAARGVRRLLERVRNFLASPRSGRRSYKNRRYRRGPVVRREIRAFGRPSDHADLDPRTAEAESVLAVDRR